MDTKTGTISTHPGTLPVRTRPGIGVWTAVVTVVAAAALIMSVMALTIAARDRASIGAAGGGNRTVATTQARLWDVDKIEAMAGRMLAERVPTEDAAVLWARRGSRPWKAVSSPGSRGPIARSRADPGTPTGLHALADRDPRQGSGRRP